MASLIKCTVTHSGSGVGRFGGRGLVLGWTTETTTTNKQSCEFQKHETCGIEQFENTKQKNPVKWTVVIGHRHSPSAQFVTVFAVHRYGCPDDGQEDNDSDDGSYDAARRRTLLWKTSTLKRKTRRENTFRRDHKWTHTTHRVGPLHNTAVRFRPCIILYNAMVCNILAPRASK